MKALVRTIETTGRIDEGCRLLLDEAVPIEDRANVRVLIFLPEDTDIDEKEWLAAASKNSSYDFLKNSDEDIYTINDGSPFYDEG